jgi:hypothetical protein
MQILRLVAGKHGIKLAGCQRPFPPGARVEKLHFSDAPRFVVVRLQPAIAVPSGHTPLALEENGSYSPNPCIG